MDKLTHSESIVIGRSPEDVSDLVRRDRGRSSCDRA